MGWAHHWANGLMGWVGASKGSVPKQTRVSNQIAELRTEERSYKNAGVGGMTTYPYIYICFLKCTFYLLLARARVSSIVCCLT